MSAYNISFHGEIKNVVELLHFSVIWFQCAFCIHVLFIISACQTA